METHELMLYLDQIERLSELAELPDEGGLDLDGLVFADFWAGVELEVTQ